MPQTSVPLSSEEIRAFPEYQQLLEQRRILAWPLCMVVLLSYYTFILAVAYFPSVMATPVGDGITSIGMVAGLGLIVLTFAVTAIFVWRTNQTSEILLKRIKEKAGAIE